jgi:hypothetical protein
MPQTNEGLGTRCANCGQLLSGRYCAQCGQKELRPDDLTVRRFFVDTVVHELTNVDGKIWRTLRALLFRPGLLTAEYSAGRRQPYINPLRIYIVAVIVYAVLTQGGLVATLRAGPVVLSIVPVAMPSGSSLEETFRRIDRFGALQKVAAAKQPALDMNAEGVRRDFHDRLESIAEPLAFGNVLLLALALYIFFRRRRRLFVEHAVFSMHLMSFVLLSSLLLVPAVRSIESHETLALLGMLGVTVWQFVYLTLAVRRYYFGPDAKGIRGYAIPAAAALLIYLLNTAFITGIQLLGGVLALRAV